MLLDLNLPGRHRLGSAARTVAGAGGSPPVVITSAITVSPLRLAEFGVAGFLPKPFPLETLVATIERLLIRSEDGDHD